MVHDPTPPARRSALRERLWEIVFEAETPAGKAFDVALLWAIGLSVTAVMLESVESVEAKWGSQLKAVEWFFTILFMAEYFLRIYLVRKPTRYIFSFFGIVDLLSWIPSFIGLLATGSHALLVVRILRVLRMFRILKMVGHVRGANLIMRGLLASRAKITVFFLAMLLLATIMGTFAYLFESGINADFKSIPDCVYWAIITITTIGYGDLAPVTVIGKALASLCGLMGYCIIAVPTGIVISETVNAALNRQDETTDACPSCGVHGHLLDAKYCRRCGEKFSEPPDPGSEQAGAGPP